MLTRVVRFLLGGISAAALWWYGSAAYNELIGWPASWLLHADPRLFDIESIERGRWLLLRSASGHFPPAIIPADQLTYNIILFIALVAAEPRLIRDRKWLLAAVALVILVASHIITLAVVTEATYATVEKLLSDRYGALETNLWFGAAMFLRMVGMLGIAFICWLMIRLWPTIQRQKRS